MSGFTIDFAILDEMANDNPENALRCGCFEGTTDEQQRLFAAAMAEVEAEEGIHPLFISGALAGYAFFTCQPGLDMHGKTADELFRNAWPKVKLNFVEDLIMGAFAATED